MDHRLLQGVKVSIGIKGALHDRNIQEAIIEDKGAEYRVLDASLEKVPVRLRGSATL